MTAPGRSLVLDVPHATPRLLLRDLQADDVDDLHVLQGDPEVVRFVPWPVRTLEQTRTWLHARLAEPGLLREGDAAAWAVERREDGRVVGSVNATWVSVQHEHAELGFAFARDVHGQGYASEAVTALLGLLFGRLGVRRVSGRADARNDASRRLMTRVGMQQEAHLREDELFKGEWTDTVVHAVLRREWAGRADGRAV